MAHPKIDANIRVGDKHEGKTALHHAVECQYFDFALVLVRSNKVDVKQVDNLNRTPLHWATWFGNVELMKELIDKGANVNAQNWTGMTPLHGAIYKNNHVAVKLLLDHKASLEIKMTDDYGSCKKGSNAYDVARTMKFDVAFLDSSKSQKFSEVASASASEDVVAKTDASAIITTAERFSKDQQATPAQLLRIHRDNQSQLETSSAPATQLLAKLQSLRASWLNTTTGKLVKEYDRLLQEYPNEAAILKEMGLYREKLADDEDDVELKTLYLENAKKDLFKALKIDDSDDEIRQCYKRIEDKIRVISKAGATRLVP